MTDCISTFVSCKLLSGWSTFFLSIEYGHKMSAFSSGREMKSQIVESTLPEILAVIRPSEQDSVMRNNLIQELKKVVKSIPSFRGDLSRLLEVYLFLFTLDLSAIEVLCGRYMMIGAAVEAFGSFSCNLYTKSGDLDISIDLPAGSSVEKERKEDLLSELCTALRRKGGFTYVIPILKPEVPILKLIKSRHGIDCDISIHNKEGENKSKMLLWLNQIDKRFREMVLLVKEWAKTHDINSSKDGSFTSYTLCLLVIFHFQTCKPAIFPPLRELYPENAHKQTEGFVNVANENVREACKSNIGKFKSHRFRRANISSLDELFISFFTKFADMSLSASNICPFSGKLERRRNSEDPIIVEDPFEWRQNSCRRVSAEKLVRISEAFQTTVAAVKQGDQNKSTLLKVLVRPSIAELIPKTSEDSSQYDVVYHESYLRGPDEYESTRNLGSAVQNQHLRMYLAPQADRYGRTVETPAAESSEGSSQRLSGLQKAGLVFGALAGAMIGAGALMSKSLQEDSSDNDDD